MESTITGISRFITEKGGMVADAQRWGKRRLAYPIKHFVEGYYVLYTFKMKPEQGKQIETNLRISEEVLRYLLINKE